MEKIEKYHLYSSLSKSKGRRCELIDDDGNKIIEYRFISKNTLEAKAKLLKTVEASSFMEAKEKLALE